jgi:DUF4097 and DUF4098 domain-containing protein YvlB
MKTASLAAAVLLAIMTASAVCAGDGRNISNVNGDVSASPGQTYDSLSTVNGEVRIGRGASAEVAKTVNGAIVLEPDVKVGRVSTVNGSLRIGEGAAVAYEASTVNGDVRLGKRARVAGEVSSVSGDIELDGAEIGGMITTYNGDIDLADGSRVLGGIHVKKPKDSNWGWGKDDSPEVRICSTCVVEGELRFDRPVELVVEPGAKIGKVIGEKVLRR